MDSMTGRRRKHPGDEASSSGQSQGQSLAPVVAAAVTSSRGKEFVPDLYRSVGGKKFRAEQPENEEEREIIRSLPSDAESALLHLRKSFPTHIFEGRLPPVMLYSQLSAILKNQYLMDTQLSKLARENKILTFSTFTSGNFLIVFLEDFVGLKREGIFERFVKEAVTSRDDDPVESLNEAGHSEGMRVKRSLEHSLYFSKESLMKRWRFEEDEIRQLVNGGYLGIQDGGMYCISLPGAGEFIKTFERGRKTVIGAVKKARFGEILQSELEKRPMKKLAPLGVLYHIYDLIGSGDVTKMDTTSGPLLRVKRKL